MCAYSRRLSVLSRTDAALLSGLVSVMVLFQVIKIGPQNGHAQAPHCTMLVTMLEDAS